jgi:hypothetical protein
LFSTIWSVGEKHVLDISLPEKLTAIIYDMFGNKVKEAKGQLKLEIDRNPLYIQWENGTSKPEIIIKAFQDAKIESKNRFVLAGTKFVVNSDGQLCAGIIIQNKTSKPVSGKIKMLCRVMGIKCGNIKFENIPPHGQKTLLLPVKFWSTTPNEIDVNILLNPMLQYAHIDL